MSATRWAIWALAIFFLSGLMWSLVWFGTTIAEHPSHTPIVQPDNGVVLYDECDPANCAVVDEPPSIEWSKAQIEAFVSYAGTEGSYRLSFNDGTGEVCRITPDRDYEFRGDIDACAKLIYEAIIRKPS